MKRPELFCNECPELFCNARGFRPRIWLKGLRKLYGGRLTAAARLPADGYSRKLVILLGPHVNEIARPMPRPTAQVEPFVTANGAKMAVRFHLAYGGAEMHVADDPGGRSSHDPHHRPVLLRESCGSHLHRRGAPVRHRYRRAF